MPTIAGYDVDPAIIKLIEEVAAERNVLAFWVLGIVLGESGGNPLAHNLTATEDSVGLLQLNRMGGQGTGYTVEELLMPRRNLQIGVPPIAAAVGKCCQKVIPSAEEMHCVFVNSGHPGGGVPIDDPRIRRLTDLTLAAWTWYIEQLPPAPPAPRPTAQVTVDIRLDLGTKPVEDVLRFLDELHWLTRGGKDG